MPSRYPAAFEGFVAPARARPQVWRLLAGLCLAGLGYALWSAGAVALYWGALGPERPESWASALPDAETPAGAFVMLSTVLGMALGTVLAARLFHARRSATLFGRAPVVPRDFVIAAGLVGVIYAASLALWFARFDPVPQLDPGRWLALLPFALLAVLIQTGAEELVFRGYLQQQLAARFRSPLVWLLLPSLGFGLAHYDPGATGADLWLVVAATALFGLAAADLTARSGSIGAAWGFHFANNTAALLVVAVKGTIPGLALFTTPYTADDPAMARLLAIDIATLGIAWFVVRRALQR